MIGARVLAFAAIAFVVSCKQTPVSGDPPDALTSPQANAIPAPLEALTQDAQAGSNANVNAFSLDAGPPPSPMRGDRALPADMLIAQPRDAKDPKEIAGWSMTAVLRTGDVAGPPKANEVSLAGLDAARRQTEPRLAIDIAQTRARVVLATRGFALPVDTEIRARVDRYGNIVILPTATTYHVVPAGALRALFGERRLDVAPLLVADVTPHGDGTTRIGLKTRRFDVETRAAKATFEIAHVPDSGEGGTLVCRILLDLMNADPATPMCGTDDVPLHAELHWTTHGVFLFDALTLTRRADLAPQLLATPPASLTYSSEAPPPLPAAVLLTSAELGAFRTSPIDVPQPLAHDAAAPIGLALANTTDELRFAYVDGVAIAWVAPSGGIELNGLPHGRYTLQWRTLLGDAIDPPQAITVPGASRAGESDAGTH